MIYLTANLPQTYGTFKQIQTDNYPFRNTFETYVASICRIGLAHDLDIHELIGYLEDNLFPDDRLPDIPDANEIVKFRFSVDNETIEQYYRNQTTTNKMTTFLLIRMTLRLSAKFGSSLSRIQRKIETIDHVPTPITPLAKPVVAPAPKPIKTARRDTPRPAPRSVALTPTPNTEPTPTTNTTPVSEKTPDMVSRLERLTQRGSEALKNVQREPIGEPMEQVEVTTNPAMSDFF